MQNSTDKGNEPTKCACGGGSSTCGGAIVMLLLVGFVFGTIVGYMAKDLVGPQLIKIFSEVMKEDLDDSDKPIQHVVEPAVVSEKKSDETKTEPDGEKKPEEGTLPAPQ